MYRKENYKLLVGGKRIQILQGTVWQSLIKNVKARTLQPDSTYKTLPDRSVDTQQACTGDCSVCIYISEGTETT